MATERATLAAIALGLAGCTTFAGEDPPSEGGGDAATATTTTSAGEGGGAGAAPQLASAFLPLLDAAHVCSLIGECPTLGVSLVASLGLPVLTVTGGAFDLRFSACLEWLATPIAEGRIGFALQREILYCVAASSCAGAAACLPVELVATGDARCEGAPEGPRCEADTLITCAADAGGSAVVCGPPLYGPGSSCVAPEGGAARCGIDAGCDAPTTCDGSFAVGCDAEGVLAAVDCALLGLACAEGDAGGCVAEEGPRPCALDDFGTSSCSADGERAYTCTGILQAQIDCDALDRTCATEGGAARCASPAEACSPYDAGVDVCDGEVLQACVGGSPLAIDCGGIGRGCVDASEGPSGSLSGRCGRIGE